MPKQTPLRKRLRKGVFQIGKTLDGQRPVRGYRHNLKEKALSEI